MAVEAMDTVMMAMATGIAMVDMDTVMVGVMHRL